MSIYNWDESYTVKVELMDEQHKKLFELLDDFYKNLSKKDNQENILKIIAGLRKYTFQHFFAEEMLMKKHNYPFLEEQKVQHHLFISKIDDYENRIKTGKLLISIEITSFLRDWLVNHIKKEDKKYAEFFNNIGVK
jgi:hemerythrin